MRPEQIKNSMHWFKYMYVTDSQFREQYNAEFGNKISIDEEIKISEQSDEKKNGI